MSIERILETINGYGNEYCQQVESEAQKEGERLYQVLIAEAKEKIQQKSNRYLDEVAHYQKREISRKSFQLQQQISEVKLKLVQELLDACLDTYLNLSPQAFIEIVDKALKKNNQDTRPRIHVDPQHYQIVLDAFGKEYQIIEDSHISHGFVLNYDSYDMNYEFVKIFEYRSQQFIRKAMDYLFEEL